jgi:hypothetical protein
LSTAARTLALGVTVGFGMHGSEEAELVGLAERCGFAHAWMWDSHLYAGGSTPAAVLERFGREIIPRVEAAEAAG